MLIRQIQALARAVDTARSRIRVHHELPSNRPFFPKVGKVKLFKVMPFLRFYQSAKEAVDYCARNGTACLENKLGVDFTSRFCAFDQSHGSDVLAEYLVSAWKNNLCADS
jgi:hypothetical protein